MNHNNNLKTFNARSTNPCSNTLSSSDLKFKIQQALPNQIEFFSVNSRFSITFAKMRKCSFRAFQNQIILQIPKHSRSFNALVFECVHKGKSKIFLLYYTKGMLHQQNLKIKENFMLFCHSNEVSRGGNFMHLCRECFLFCGHWCGFYGILEDMTMNFI